MTPSLKIPLDKRSDFAQPLGTLISGSRKETVPKVEEKFKNLIESNPDISLRFYLVGDIVVKDFLSSNFLKEHVKVAVIDEKTQRKRINIHFGDLFGKKMELKNPAGIIHEDSWVLLKNALKFEERTLIVVTEGEEDLLVIPLVLDVPMEVGVRHFVIYGQPPLTDANPPIPQGVVLVEVDKAVKERVRSLVDLMEEV